MTTEEVTNENELIVTNCKEIKLCVEAKTGDIIPTEISTSETIVEQECSIHEGISPDTVENEIASIHTPLNDSIDKSTTSLFTTESIVVETVNNSVNQELSSIESNDTDQEPISIETDQMENDDVSIVENECLIEQENGFQEQAVQDIVEMTTNDPIICTIPFNNLINELENNIASAVLFPETLQAENSDHLPIEAKETHLEELTKSSPIKNNNVSILDSSESLIQVENTDHLPAEAKETHPEESAQFSPMDNNDASILEDNQVDEAEYASDTNSDTASKVKYIGEKELSMSLHDSNVSQDEILREMPQISERTLRRWILEHSKARPQTKYDAKLKISVIERLKVIQDCNVVSEEFPEVDINTISTWFKNLKSPNPTCFRSQGKYDPLFKEHVFKRMKELGNWEKTKIEFPDINVKTLNTWFLKVKRSNSSEFDIHAQEVTTKHSNNGSYPQELKDRVQQLIEQGDTNMQIKLKIPEVNPKTVDRWVRDFRQSVDRAATAKRKRQEQDDAVVPKITKVYSVEKQECFNYLSQGFSLDQIQELIRTASKRKLFTWEWLYHKKTLNSENSSESD